MLFSDGIKRRLRVVSIQFLSVSRVQRRKGELRGVHIQTCTNATDGKQTTCTTSRSAFGSQKSGHFCDGGCTGETEKHPRSRRDYKLTRYQASSGVSWIETCFQNRCHSKKLKSLHPYAHCTFSGLNNVPSQVSNICACFKEEKIFADRRDEKSWAVKGNLRKALGKTQIPSCDHLSTGTKPSRTDNKERGFECWQHLQKSSCLSFHNKLPFFSTQTQRRKGTLLPDACGSMTNQQCLTPVQFQNQHISLTFHRSYTMFIQADTTTFPDHHRTFTKSVKVSNEDIISEQDIKTFLVENNMKVEQGHTCFITHCPRLAQNNKKTQPGMTDTDALFVNMTSGQFVCKHCDKRGRWQDLQDNLLLLASKKRKKDFQCFKEVDSVYDASQQSPQVQDLLDRSIGLKSCSADVTRQILDDFDIHGLKIATLDKYGVKFDIQTRSLVLPAFDGKGQLVGVRRLMCTIPEENENLRVIQESVLPRTGPLGLFGFNTLSDGTKEVVLTSTELDALAVFQETQTPSLALPNGFSSLPQEVLPALERFSKLVLWLGDDMRAWEAAKMFAKKLGNDRCYIIRPSEDDPSPLEALRRGVRLREVLDKAKPIMHKSIVSFSHLRQEIFSELLHAEQVAGVKWKRYPVLNKLLKGHRRGELTVFTGPTGSGKTTFISDYSLDLCMQGVNTLWGSFEINNVRLGKLMLTQFAQLNLSKHLDQFDAWADRFEQLPMYFMTFHGQESIRKVIEAMSHAVYVHDIAHVVVDNLQFMLGSNGEMAERFTKQDIFISSFRKFATNMNCHVTVVIHPRKEKETDELTTASVFGSAKATQEADNVLILQDKRLMSLRGRKYLQITKNRFDGELGVMLLKFEKETLSFVGKEKSEKSKRSDAHDDDLMERNPLSAHSTIYGEDMDH